MLSISFMLLAAFAVLYTSDTTYVIGKDRLKTPRLMPSTIRHILEFVTPYENTEPYAVVEDMLSSSLRTSRVLFVMGDASPDIKESQQLYDELKQIYDSTATRSATPVFHRYAIDYAVLEVPDRASASEIQKYTKWKQIIASSKGVSIYRELGKVTMYTVEREVMPESYAILSDPLLNYPDTINAVADTEASASALYKTDKSEPYKRHFPFSDIREGTFFTEKNIRLEDRDGYLYLTRKLDTSNHIYTIQNEATKSAIRTQITNGTVVASTKKDSVDTVALGKIQVKNCGSKKGTLETNIADTSVSVNVSTGAIACFSYRLTNTVPGTQYLVHMRSENTEGVPLRVTIIESGTGKTITSGNLNNASEYILLSPDEATKGYTLSFRSESDMNFASQNILSGITMLTFPLNEAQHIALTHEKDILNTDAFMRTYGEPNGLLGYQYSPDPVEHTTSFIFWQPSSTRWTAYVIPTGYPSWKKTASKLFPFVFAQPLKHHYVVNGWAHGWNIPPDMNGQLLIFSFIRFLTSVTLVFASILIVISVIIVIA